MRRGHSNTALVLILLVGIFAGSAGTMLFIAGTYQAEQPVLDVSSNESEAQIRLLAVDQDGNGVSTPLVVG
jgi:capsular polysaccharide biosynthesis protein